MLKCFGTPEPKNDERPDFLLCELTARTIIICNNAVGFNFVAEFFPDMINHGDSEHWMWSSSTDNNPVSIEMDEISCYHYEYLVTEPDSEPQTIVLINICTSTTEEFYRTLQVVKTANSVDDIWFVSNVPGTDRVSEFALTEFKNADDIWNRGFDWFVKEGLIAGRFGLHVFLDSGEKIIK